jgi:SRSO17 transposase
MSLLKHPRAQALLEDATVSAATVRGCRARLSGFLQRYLPCFYRKEQHDNARLVLEGKLSGLERKTSEPIAHQAGVHRKPVQNFVGAGAWDDEAVTEELRRHVSEVLGTPEGILALDPSAFPKKGDDSCGVQRQWCGRLGKLDNCQVGVFLAYVTSAGYAPLDRQLYLPKERASDRQHRRQSHVPDSVKFAEKWRIGLDLIDRAQVPYRWVVGDDELGRVTAFRSGVRSRSKQYVLDVPCNTLIREIGSGGSFERADAWAARQPSSRWQKMSVRDGAKGPLVVRALAVQVQAKDEDGCVGPRETLVVVRAVDGAPRTDYALSNAGRHAVLAELVQVRSARHRIEELFATGNGEIGLDHYEVRSWVGWHHHMTLSMLALWFLLLERRRVRKKRQR